MNITLKNIVAIILTIALPALMGAAQARAVEYKSTYRSIQSQPEYHIVTTATAPFATFQSTSAMPVSDGVGTSTLNEDGTVNEEAYGVGQNNVSGPRRVGGQSGTPGQEGTQQPLGDGMIPLLLVAMGYIVYKLGRRRKMVP